MADTFATVDWFPLLLSLKVAVISTAIVLVGGTALAYLLSHREFRGKEVLDSAITLPLVALQVRLQIRRRA